MGFLSWPMKTYISKSGDGVFKTRVSLRHTTVFTYLLVFVYCQFWPIFIAKLRKPRKIGTTYRILVKIALSDSEFIVVCVKIKTRKKPTPISWEIAFFSRVLKIQLFWSKCNGQFWLIFIAEIRKARKKSKYLSDFGENSLIWRRFYCSLC